MSDDSAARAGQWLEERQLHGGTGGKNTSGSYESPGNPNSGDPHPDNPYGFGFHGDHERLRGDLEREGTAEFNRARYGEGKSTEDAVNAARERAGFDLDVAATVAEIEAWEAENPDKVAKLREKWEAIVAGFDRRVTDDHGDALAAQQGQPGRFMTDDEIVAVLTKYPNTSFNPDVLDRVRDRLPTPAEGQPVTDDQLAAVIAHTDAPDEVPA
jgi:hypothetical protein